MFAEVLVNERLLLINLLRLDTNPSSCVKSERTRIYL